MTARRKLIAGGLFVLLIFASCSLREIHAVKNPNRVAKNTILMIVDGMGFEYVKALRIYQGQSLASFERFPCQTSVTTCSLHGADRAGACIEGTDNVTDSAAAATAMATGKKVANGVISKDVEADTNIPTVLEILKRAGKSTGIIATKLITDATPAAFVSHADHRTGSEEIIKSMFSGPNPNVVFGADVASYRAVAKGSQAPYAFVHSAKELKELAARLQKAPDCDGADCPYVYGGFGQHQMIPGSYAQVSGLPLEATPKEKYAKLEIPHLSEMTDAALAILSKNKQGFFLMVESSMPDMIGHYHSSIDANKSSPQAIEALVKEMKEVDNTIKVIEKFVAANPDTLVVLTADHETGGLVIEQDKTSCLGKMGCMPTVRWTSGFYEAQEYADAHKHTNANVPLFATGVGSERFCRKQVNNIDIVGLAFNR